MKQLTIAALIAVLCMGGMTGCRRGNSQTGTIPHTGETSEMTTEMTTKATTAPTTQATSLPQPEATDATGDDRWEDGETTHATQEHPDGRMRRHIPTR